MVKEVPVEKIGRKVVEVEKETIRTVEVEKPVEVIKEVVREVRVPGETVVVEKEVVKEVTKEVVVEREKIVQVVATATPAPVLAMTGTIPGSKVTIAVEAVGALIKEPRSNLVLYGCRPGCMPVKDDFFLIDGEWTILPHVIKSWDFGSDTRTWTLDMQEGIGVLGRYSRNH